MKAVWMARFFGAGLTVLALLGLAGCRTESEAVSTGPKLVSSEALRPSEDLPDGAVLKLAGMEIPVTLETEQDGIHQTIELQSNGETIDHERYIVSDESVKLLFAAGETFDPPLPLLIFPMTVGDSWKWKGTMIADEARSKAEAKIVSQVSKAELKGSTVPSVKVMVDLQLAENQQSKPVKRTLSFWVVEGKGVVRREFGEESVREPQPK